MVFLFTFAEPSVKVPKGVKRKNFQIISTLSALKGRSNIKHIKYKMSHMNVH